MCIRDRDTAEWFAHRFGEEGTVYEAQISKEHILAFFNGRNESEVVVDPKYLEPVSYTHLIAQSKWVRFIQTKQRRARSSVGRAFGSHPRGRGFESLRVHHKKP